MKVSLLFVFALLSYAFLAQAYPISNSNTITRSKSLPQGWSVLETSSNDATFAKQQDTKQTISLIFAIRQRNEEWLKAKFVSVSNPRSSDYANYLSSDELANMVDGHPEHFNNVVSLLQSHGVEYRVTKAKNYVLVDKMDVALASTIFAAKFNNFISQSGKRVTKTLSYTLPDSIANSVDFVLGLDNFPSLTEHGTGTKRSVSTHSSRIVNDQTSLGVSPPTLDGFYNVSGYVATNSQTTQAVASFLSQYFDPEDLSTFQARYNIPNNPIAVVQGVNIPTNPGVEATLDVEYITAVALNVSTWFIFEASLVNDGQEDFLKYLIGQLNASYTPLVHSFSYGDIASSIPNDYKQRVELEFQKFGVIGRTILFAAGDNGVRCTNNQFDPEWPTSSPSVTSVGGTINVAGKEQVWSGGGGGFSNDFPRPTYQDAAVTGYLLGGTAPDKKYYNSTSRAYPDVSAFAMGFEIFYQGAPGTVGGTSAATPTWASIVSNLNDVLLNAGRQPLGFMNPVLYEIGAIFPAAFHDITVGSNPDGACSGFNATKGWDPASGYGTPDFGYLASVLLNLF